MFPTFHVKTKDIKSGHVNYCRSACRFLQKICRRKQHIIQLGHGLGLSAAAAAELVVMDG